MKGDYLFRTFIGLDFQNGMWGLVRVGDAGKDVVTVTTYCGPPTTEFTVAGTNTVNPSNHHMAATVTITGTGLNIPPVPVDPMTGRWSFKSSTVTAPPQRITVTSAQGGATTSAAMCAIQTPEQTLRTQLPLTRITRDLDRFRLAPPATLKRK